jgi:hypothetical protein
MAAAIATSIIEHVLGLALASTNQDAGNRLVLEGLSFGPRPDGTFEIAIRTLEAAALRLASGPLTLELGRLALNGIVAVVRMEGGRPSLVAFEATSAELSEVKVQGPLILPTGDTTTAAGAAASWCLDPLASADGTIRAKIIDAHLMFDADVTVIVRQGRVDLNQATVAHTGPDSRMGISRLGLYVDAPNGRSYLYQFSSPPVGGVEYERRGAFLGARVTDRGKLELQPFAEGMLRQHGGGLTQGITQQTRVLLGRTSVTGEVRVGDGKFAVPGARAELLGRAEGRNVVRLHSEAVGRGVTMEMDSLSARNGVLGPGDTQLVCDEVAGALTLQLLVDGTQLRFALQFGKLNLRQLHARLPRAR